MPIDRPIAATGRGCGCGPRSRAVRLAVLLLSAASLGGGCSRQRANVSDYDRDKAPRDGPWIIALPNPVVAGPRGGKTLLTWDTGEGYPGMVFVSIDRQPETFLTSSDRYYHETVLQRGHSYEFRLYGSSRTIPLSSVRVNCR